MHKTLEVLLAPAEIAALKERDLSGTVCVVFDILRATSSMVTALANGAEEILPVAEISEALTIRHRNPEVLLAGERDGLCIGADLTGTIAFDFGNSPREFTEEKVRGKRIVMTTTNGTRALRACAGARSILVASFLNLAATAKFLAQENPNHLLLLCSGTFDQAAYEDMLGSGSLCELLWSEYETGAVADSARVCQRLYALEQNDLAAAISSSRNGARLLSRPELREDVSFCLQRDVFNLVALMDQDGWVRKRSPARL